MSTQYCRKLFKCLFPKCYLNVKNHQATIDFSMARLPLGWRPKNGLSPGADMGPEQKTQLNGFAPGVHWHHRYCDKKRMVFLMEGALGVISCMMLEEYPDHWVASFSFDFLWYLCTRVSRALFLSLQFSKHIGTFGGPLAAPTARICTSWQAPFRTFGTERTKTAFFETQKSVAMSRRPKDFQKKNP